MECEASSGLERSTGGESEWTLASSDAGVACTLAEELEATYASLDRASLSEMKVSEKMTSY